MLVDEEDSDVAALGELGKGGLDGRHGRLCGGARVSLADVAQVGMGCDKVLCHSVDVAWHDASRKACEMTARGGGTSRLRTTRRAAAVTHSSRRRQSSSCLARGDPFLRGGGP